MNIKPVTLALVSLALAFLMCVDAQAQDGQYFLPSLGVWKSPRQKPDNSRIEEAKRPPRVGNQEVESNMSRHREEVAHLRAEGKTESEMHGILLGCKNTAAGGSIEGILYQSDGVTPFRSYMSVGAYNEYGVYAGYGYTLYSNGVYKIQDLPTGNYYVQLNWSGSADYIPLYYNGVEDWRQATLVHVNAGLATTGINFVCRQRQIQGGAISGAVYSADSIRLAQCSVTAHDLSMTGAWGGSTDSLGRYVINSLPAGDYKIRASSYGNTNYLPQWYDRASAIETAAIIHVDGLDTVKGKDFFLDRGGVIAGHVVTEDGAPVARYACYIAIYDSGMSQIASNQNDSLGGFVVTRLPSGNYTLEFRFSGTLNYVDGWYDGASQSTQATLIHVAAPETTAITIVLRRGGTIAGNVAFAVRSGVSVLVYNEQGKGIQQGRADENGAYAVPRLLAGRYKVLASTVKTYGYTGPHVQDQWYSQASDFAHAAFVSVHLGDTTKNIDFDLKSGASISCRVVDQFGAALSTGSVYLCDPRGARIQSASVSNGNCSFGGLATGQYKLFYSSSRNAVVASEWFDGKNSFQNAALISVTAPGPTQNVTFTLLPAGTLGGYVTDAGGQRLADREVEVVLYDAVTGGYAGSSMTTFVSGFQGLLLPGKYKLGLFSVNRNTHLEDSLAVCYYEHGKRFSDSSSKAVTVGGGVSLSLGDWAMERTTGTIAGTIYSSETGQPVDSGMYLVVAFDEEGRPAAYSTYSSETAPLTGEYTLRGLWPGTYAVLAGGIMAPSDEEFAQWYDGVRVDIDSVLNVPMPMVPSAARLVTVGAGRTEGIDFHIGLATGVIPGMPARMPQGFLLSQNFPNPFNPTTTIRYEVPYTSRVVITLYDLLGQEVRTLIHQEQAAGTYSIVVDASGLASGIYCYRMAAGSFSMVRKLMVLR